MAKTKEPQYGTCLDIQEKYGFTRLGLMSNGTWHEDPKRLAFVLSRYKFVAKMLQGKGRVLEIGCADGFASRIVNRDVGHLTATDFDPLFIDDALANQDPVQPIAFIVHDILDKPAQGVFDAAYSLDVLEHIEQAQEDRFMSHVCQSLSDDGVFVVGMPSLNSQDHASEQSRAGHVNCKQGDELRDLAQRYFKNVFVFSMNDEVVHTGFYPMAHYYLALCCGPHSK